MDTQQLEQQAKDFLDGQLTGAAALAADAKAKWDEFRARATVYMAQSAVSAAAGNVADADMLLRNTLAEAKGLGRELAILGLGFSEASMEDAVKAGTQFLIAAVLKAV